MDRMSTKELKQLRNLYFQPTLSCSKKLKWIQTLDTILSTVKITWNKIIILDYYYTHPLFWKEVN